MLGALSSAAGDTLPNVSDLIQHRMVRRTNDAEEYASSTGAAGEADASDRGDLREQFGVQSPAAAAALRADGQNGAAASPRAQQQQGRPRRLSERERRPSLFSLGQGAGARRLAEVHVRAAIQLLLVQACSEVYTQHSRLMPPGAAVVLLDTLRGIANHAASVDADGGLRHSLLLAQAADKVGSGPQVKHMPWLRHPGSQGRGCAVSPGISWRPVALALCSVRGSWPMLHNSWPTVPPTHTHAPPHFTTPHTPPPIHPPVQVPPERALPDPPLLRLEAEASQAYLSVLLHVQAAASEPVKAACSLEARLTQLCLRNLERFEQQELEAADSGDDDGEGGRVMDGRASLCCTRSRSFGTSAPEAHMLSSRVDCISVDACS